MINQNTTVADSGENRDARKGDMKLWTNVNRHGGLEAVHHNGEGIVQITTKDGTRITSSAKSFMDTFPKFGMNKTADYTIGDDPVPYEDLTTGGDAMRHDLRSGIYEVSKRANRDVHDNTGESAEVARNINRRDGWFNHQNRSTAVEGVYKPGDFNGPAGEKYTSVKREDKNSMNRSEQ